MLPAPGVIDNLVRKNNGTRLQDIGNTADRIHRNDIRDTCIPQGPEIGTIVHDMRRDGMGTAVARQKDHIRSCQTAGNQR